MFQQTFNLSTILLVDDDPNNLNVLSDLLKDTNLEIVIAMSGENAIRKAKNELPDLILLDILMPLGIDGFTTCQNLKSDSITQDIPIIFMSSLSDPADKVKGLSIGAVDYITKPFDRREILARVHQHLKSNNLTRMLKQQNTFLRWENQEKTFLVEELHKLNEQLDLELKINRKQFYEASSELQTEEINLSQKSGLFCYYNFPNSQTELFNRYRLTSPVSKLLHQQVDDFYAILFIDIDRFKSINERFGNFIGDIFLYEFGNRLTAVLGEKNSIARFGGDEFVILIEKVRDLDDVIVIVQEIQAKAQLPYVLNGCEIFATISIGIAIPQYSHSTLDSIVRDAEVAMNFAKNEGRGLYKVFDPNIHSLAYSSFRIESELKRALDREEFSLKYQPIFSLKTRCLVGFEALLRWKDIPPSRFISIAEETGLINPIGWWVFEKACLQLSVWQQKFPKYKNLNLSINFSPKQLTQKNLLQRVEEVINLYQLSKGCLSFEITESCFSSIFYSLSRTLIDLKALGISLSIDDFGSGYSSLSRLLELPIDTLKLDSLFIKNLDLIPNCNLTCRSIIKIGQKLGLRIVAEGIETNKQVEQLKKMGCDYGQGYIFSQPLSADAVEQLLSVLT